MRQSQKNLFYFYRGPRPRGDRFDYSLERQLEDNTTKALIFVLERTERTAFLVPFLRRFLGIRIGAKAKLVQFALQRVDISRPKVQSRIALGLSPIPKFDHARKSSHRSGRPDAWIWMDGVFSALLETKVRGKASLDQVRRHIAGASGWRGHGIDLRSHSWSDVYEFFESTLQRNRQLDGVSKLLVGEFLRYLRMTNLSSTTTFDLEDFGFFLLPTRERQGRSFLKRKLLGFSQALSSTRAMRRMVREYAGKTSDPGKFVHPGVFRKDATNFWITIGRKERRHHCHFTVRISERGISIEAFSPHKRFTRRLVAKILERRHDFVNSLRPMKGSEPYLIRLREAHYKDPHSPYKGQRIGRFLDFLQVHPSIATANNIRQLIVEPMKERLRRRDLRPELFVIREFPLSQLVGNRDVVRLVASAALKMLKYVRFALDLK